MKKISNLRIIIPLLAFFACCIVLSPRGAFAACDSAKWGVNTGSSASLAGLVVHTTNNGVDQNMDVTVHGNNSGINKLNSSYAVSSTLYDYANYTGSLYYSATQSSQCYTGGYLVMGYGSSSSQGNTYALDCKNSAGAHNQFYARVAGANPSTHGYWQYSISGQYTLDAAYHVWDSTETNNDNPIVYFTVNNGYTTWVHFNWVTFPNNAPSIVPTAPTQNQVFTTSSPGIWLNANASDPDGDTVYSQIALQKSTDGGANYGAWEYFTIGPLPQGVNRTVKSYVPASLLGIGKYKWVIMTTDEHGMTNSVPPGSVNTWSHNDPQYFTVENPVPTVGVTLTANPSSGFAPQNDVILTATVTGTATGDTEYRFDCTNNGSYDVTQTNINTTGTCDYPSPGNYVARVQVTRQGITAVATASITVNGVPDVSCHVTPQRGPSSFVVMVTPTLAYASGGTFDYDMQNDGTYEYTGSEGAIYHTYPTPGVYTVRVRHSTGLTKTCPEVITVTNPSDGEGGEVTP